MFAHDEPNLTEKNSIFSGFLFHCLPSNIRVHKNPHSPFQKHNIIVGKQLQESPISPEFQGGKQARGGGQRGRSSQPPWSSTDPLCLARDPSVTPRGLLQGKHRLRSLSFLRPRSWKRLSPPREDTRERGGWGCPVWGPRAWFWLSASPTPGRASPWLSAWVLNPESLEGEGWFCSEHLLLCYWLQVWELSKSEAMLEPSSISLAPMALGGLERTSDPSQP